MGVSRDASKTILGIEERIIEYKFDMEKINKQLMFADVNIISNSA